MSIEPLSPEQGRRLRDALARRQHLPESTYRLQFHAGFTFRDATAIVPYLRDLGITHVYASPYLKARTGSTHGYDVIDHHSLNPEVGSQADYEAWLAELARNGLWHILDTVPNHVGVATNENAWWNDVLENGPASRYANYFDISWRGSPRPELHDKVLLPLLGKPYAEALEAGELRLKFEDGKFVVHYYDRRFPISPRTVRPALTDKTVEEFNGTPGNSESFDRLDELLMSQSYRLAYWRVAPDEINYRRFFDINDLAALSMERKEVFDSTHELILRWLGSGKLQGLRIDHPDGLYDPEQYFLRLQQAYVLAVARAEGIAIDPSQATALAEELGVAGELARRTKGETASKLAGYTGSWTAPGWPLYVTVEKILAIGEPLPADWAVHGTSGYDFLDMVNGLFVESKNEAAFSTIYQQQAPGAQEFDDLVYQKKRLILNSALASELHMLAHRLDRLAQLDRRSRDFTANGLRIALREVVACFPVYRSYISDRGVRDDDRKYMNEALARAIARNPSTEPSVFHFIADMVLLKPSRFFTEDDRADQLRFAGKFQQLTAPVTAKGIEDTTFYIYNRLVSLNEVGGNPGQFGIAADALHAYLADRQAKWPYALSPLSTHDTKRSEDVRARINVLSEIPDQWHERISAWSRLNARHRQKIAGAEAPDPNDEYLLYQTLVGAWPLGDFDSSREAFVPRIQAYMEKAIREAKVHTSWTNPNVGYEKAIKEFVAVILEPGSEFVRDLLPFQGRVSHLGMFNSLSQTLIRLTAPGVPDTYQGTELWDFSLVDPDNRRAVDYARRKDALRELHQAPQSAQERSAFARELLQSKDDGRIKLFLTWRTLSERQRKPELFTAGEYLPARATGSHAEHVFAFARRKGSNLAIAIAPRFFSRLMPSSDPDRYDGSIWADTRLIIPGVAFPTQLIDVLSGRAISVNARTEGGCIALKEALTELPIALLVTD